MFLFWSCSVGFTQLARRYLDLITKDFFCCNTLDRRNFLQSLNIEFLFVAKNEILEGFVCHIGLLEVDDVIERYAWQVFVNLLAQTVIQAHLLCSHIS